MRRRIGQAAIPLLLSMWATGANASVTIEENTTSFCGVNGVIATQWTGYSGAGYADTTNAVGSAVSWQVNIPTAGNYTVSWRYANGGTDNRNVNVQVDGFTKLSNVAFPPTGAWGTWSSLSQTVSITTAGSHRFRIAATTATGTANIDRFYVGQTATGALCSGSGSSSSSSSSSGGSSSGFDPGSPSAGATHPRVRMINGCSSQTMYMQWLTAPGFTGGAFSAPNRAPIAPGGSITYNIPDKGLASMRWWPAWGCDGAGNNCRVGASGGPPEFGFTCPPAGCAPPIDSKFEATFGCITGIASGSCQGNPSAPGSGLGRNDWWNTSAVDGFTAGYQVRVNGYCPAGGVTSGDFAGPGGPAGGVINCLGLNISGCPTTENLSSNGQFPALASVNLRANNPAGGVAGCYSPAGKLTYSNWGNTPTYTPNAPQAQWYACPTPPISPSQCSAGPAASTKFRNYIHSVCPSYAYAYDDGFGLATCPASTLVTYDVTFGCPP